MKRQDVIYLLACKQIDNLGFKTEPTRVVYNVGGKQIAFSIRELNYKSVDVCVSELVRCLNTPPKPEPWITEALFDQLLKAVKVQLPEITGRNLSFFLDRDDYPIAPSELTSESLNYLVGDVLDYYNSDLDND